MTQQEKVLEYIVRNGSITALDAFGFGCARLAARVSDLRKAGYNIVSESETRINKDGERKTYARYRMGD